MRMGRGNSAFPPSPAHLDHVRYNLFPVVSAVSTVTVIAFTTIVGFANTAGHGYHLATSSPYSAAFCSRSADVRTRTIVYARANCT
jgi:hypothetical protein